MTAAEDALARCRAHHNMVAQFGARALSDCDLETLLHEASEWAATGTGVHHAKVLEYRPATDDLLVVSGIGWRPGVVGHAALSSDMRSPPGRAFRTGEAVCISDLATTQDFEFSALLREHNICSLLNVPIRAEGAPWGVLEIDSEKVDGVTEDDAPFLLGFANLLGRAIEHRRWIAQREAASLEREVLLREREVLFRELHHRVGNNFHAIAGMIHIETRRAAVGGPPALEKIEDRVAGIIDAHEQLSLRDVESDVSLGLYLNSFLHTLRPPPTIRLTKAIGDATVSLRIAVRVGMILNEMVTNSLKHAFDGTKGGTISVALTVDQHRAQARLVVSDDGRGMAPAGPTRGSGLTLIGELVTQLGGRIERDSTPGRGTTRTVIFPLQS